MINGGLVQAFDTREENALIGYDRYFRVRLVQHHTKKFYHLFDAMVRYCPELQELTEWLHKHHERLYKYIRGRIIGLMLIRYLAYLLQPQAYAHRGDLIFFANYKHLQQFLFRMVKMLRMNYNLEAPFDRCWSFKIQQKNLYKLSQMWAEDMLPLVEEKLVPKYKKLKRV